MVSFNGCFVIERFLFKRQMTKMLGPKITRVLINFNATVNYCEMVPPT
jgi:hypothetical protein